MNDLANILLSMYYPYCPKITCFLSSVYVTPDAAPTRTSWHSTSDARKKILLIYHPGSVCSTCKPAPAFEIHSLISQACNSLQLVENLHSSISIISITQLVTCTDLASESRKKVITPKSKIAHFPVIATSQALSHLGELITFKALPTSDLEPTNRHSIPVYSVALTAPDLPLWSKPIPRI